MPSPILWNGTALILAFVLSLGSCRSTTPPEALPTEVKLQIKAAADAIQENQFNQARQIIQSLKSSPGQEKFQDSIHVLELRLRGRELGSKIEKASTLRAEPAVFASGKMVTVTLNLNNPEAEILMVPTTISGIPLIQSERQGGVYGRLFIQSVSYDPFGNTVTDNEVRAFSTEQELRIEPQKSWVQSSTLPVSLGEGFVFRFVRVFCQLRVPTVLLGQEQYSIEVLNIAPAFFRVYPNGYERLAEDPMRSLEKAILQDEEKFDAHVFLACVMLSDEQKKMAVKKCIEALSSQSATRRRVLMASLRWLTGENDALMDESKWKTWWSVNRKDYEAEKP